MLASLVIPAGIRSVAIIAGVYAMTYFSTSGLVPTKLISPHSTFISCGISSSLYFLMTAPTLVILESPPTVTSEPFLSASFTMVLNLNMRNFLPYCVIRSCLKKTGPLLSTFIQTARTSITGESSTRRTADIITSKMRLNTMLVLFLLRCL